MEDLPIYESFIGGKMAKIPFIAKGHKAKECLELVHTDMLCDDPHFQAPFQQDSVSSLVWRLRWRYYPTKEKLICDQIYYVRAT